MKSPKSPYTAEPHFYTSTLAHSPGVNYDVSPDGRSEELKRLK